jgi:surface antigen
VDTDKEYSKSKNRLGFWSELFLFFRSNITVFTVIFLLGYVSITNTSIPGNNFQKGSILFNYLDGKGGNEDGSVEIIVKNISSAKNEKSDSAINHMPLVKIASADSNFMGNLGTYIDTNTDTKKAVPDIYKESGLNLGSYEAPNPVIVQSSSFLSPSSYYDKSLADLKYGIVKYTVQPGDTPSSIATSFGISTYTVLWANNLRVGDYIKPDQELEILPVTGVKHIITEKDTIESIAKKYKADMDEIIVFNDLPADGSLTAGKVLIIPNGEKEAPLKPKPRITNSRSKLVSSYKYKTSKNLNPQRGHRFPYGYCTWYVASKVYVPWSGHAKSWLYNARAYGYKTGKTPVAGSIVVTTENRWYGHVAYVEAVHGNTITISEMNYVGWGRKSVRVLPINSPVIRGYIYVK